MAGKISTKIGAVSPREDRGDWSSPSSISSNGSKNIKKISMLLLVAAAFGLPLIMRSPTYLHIVILIFFYAYLTTSWNMVGGFAGVLPLGHSVFIGTGAYTSTILFLQYGISPWIGMVIGGVIAMGLGIIMGLPTLKMRGAYFALATIAFAEGVRVMI